MKKTKKRKGLLAGLVIGAGLGVLFAPKKGSETRKDLMRKFDELKNKAKDITFIFYLLLLISHLLGTSDA